jgi:hypothetical protein
LKDEDEIVLLRSIEAILAASKLML